MGDPVIDGQREEIHAVDGKKAYYYHPATGECEQMSGGCFRYESQPVENADLHTFDTDGKDIWNLRSPLSNCNYAQVSLENRGTVVTCLYNYDNWDIIGTEEIGGRKCVHIEGRTAKKDIDRFTIYADEETGVILRYYAYDRSGILTERIITEDLAFNEQAEAVSIPELAAVQDRS